jgi:hypothetical protein
MVRSSSKLVIQHGHVKLKPKLDNTFEHNYL